MDSSTRAMRAIPRLSAPSVARPRFRGDAAFALPAPVDLPQAEGRACAIRIKGAPTLHQRIAWRAKRRRVRPPHHVVHFCTSFRCRAKHGSKARRGVGGRAKVEVHSGDPFRRVDLIAAKCGLPNARVHGFCKGRAASALRAGLHCGELRADGGDSVDRAPVPDIPARTARKGRFRMIGGTVRRDPGGRSRVPEGARRDAPGARSGRSAATWRPAAEIQNRRGRQSL